MDTAAGPHSIRGCPRDECRIGCGNRRWSKLRPELTKACHVVGTGSRQAPNSGRPRCSRIRPRIRPPSPGCGHRPRSIQPRIDGPRAQIWVSSQTPYAGPSPSRGNPQTNRFPGPSAQSLWPSPPTLGASPPHSPRWATGNPKPGSPQRPAAWRPGLAGIAALRTNGPCRPASPNHSPK